MARNITKRLRNPKKPVIPVNNNMGGFRNTWAKYGIARNAYVDCKNIVISEKGWFKRRRTADQVWVEPDASTTRVYGMWYHKWFWWIRVKWTNVQTISTIGGTWTTVDTWYTVTGKNVVTFLSFQATSTTGAVSKTISQDSNPRYLHITGAGMTPNEHVGKLLKIGSEIKMINGNTEDIIYIQEKFQGSYASWTSLEIVEQVEAVYMFTPGQNVKIWRGVSSFEDLSFSYDTAALQSSGGATNAGRILAIKNDNKVWVSELGTGEFFQDDSFLPVEMQWDMQSIKEISDQMVVHSEYGRARIVGNSPDNYQVIPSMTNKWVVSPGSVASGNNIQYFLSHEGIENLNTIENATVTEGISLTDIMKKIFERHADFSGAQAAISNGRLYLSIEDWVYIYDLERSVKFHKPIFTMAQYDECSQTVVSDAVAGEWTFATDVGGQLYFGQWAKVYRITDEAIGPEETQQKLKYDIEFPLEYMDDLRVDKKLQKYFLFLQNNKNIDLDLWTTQTRVKVYISKNEGTFELIQSFDNIFDIECFFSDRVKSYSLKVEVEDMLAIVDTQVEFISSLMEFYFFGRK